MSECEWFLGLDLGGTKIGSGVVTRAGEVITRNVHPTHAERGRDAVVDGILGGLRQVMRDAGIAPGDVAAIGVGAPGPLDIPRGILTDPPNLPGWHNVPLRQIIEEAIEVRTYLENDANAAAIGEYLYGAGRGTREMIYVTVSTGIGGGLILNGQIYHGVSGGAGEIGHMTIVPDGPRCGCGNLGCLEAMASGTAIAREGADLVKRGVKTLIGELAQGAPDGVSARVVAQAMEQGDPYATAIVQKAMWHLGVGMANLVNLFNPEMIVLGGGLTNLGEVLLGPVRRGITLHAFTQAVQQVRVTLAQLGTDVGIIGAAGAAMMARERV